MESKEIIEEYWDYDVDYYDEYERKISYISYSDEISIDLSLETNNISIYRFFRSTMIRMVMMVKMHILILCRRLIEYI